MINTYALHSKTNSTMLLLLNFLLSFHFVFPKNFRTQRTFFLISDETNVVDKKEHWKKSQLHRKITIVQQRAPPCNTISFTLVIKCTDILVTILRIYFVPYVNYGSLCDHSYCARYGQHEKREMWKELLLEISLNLWLGIMTRTEFQSPKSQLLTLAIQLERQPDTFTRIYIVVTKTHRVSSRSNFQKELTSNCILLNQITNLYIYFYWLLKNLDSIVFPDFTIIYIKN